jgi:hypothetical protein
MKVADYVRRNEAVLPPELAALVLQETHIWSNGVCCGYLVRAMENAGFDREHIMSAVRGMHQAFDELTIEEAESVWRKW